jgi:hypothetical protein
VRRVATQKENAGNLLLILNQSKHAFSESLILDNQSKLDFETLVDTATFRVSARGEGADVEWDSNRTPRIWLAAGESDARFGSSSLVWCVKGRPIYYVIPPAR